MTELDGVGSGGGGNATEDDSDLASLAKEFAKEEIQVDLVYKILNKWDIQRNPER